MRARGQSAARGGLTRRAQAGAIAVILVDDGRCGPGFACAHLGDRTQEPDAGFARKDNWLHWRDVVVPVVMVSASDGDRLRRLMQLRAVEVHGHGYQMVNEEHM